MTKYTTLLRACDYDGVGSGQGPGGSEGDRGVGLGARNDDGAGSRGSGVVETWGTCYSEDKG